MGIVWHDDAPAIFAQHDADGTELRIDRVLIGTLTAGNRYDAVGDETDPVDTTPEEFTTGFAINRGGPTIDTSLSLARPTATRRASEIYFYAGTDLLAVWANQASNIFTQTTTQTALMLLAYTYQVGSAPSPITVQAVTTIAMATTTVAGIVELSTDAEVASPPSDPKALSTDNMDALNTRFTPTIASHNSRWNNTAT